MIEKVKNLFKSNDIAVALGLILILGVMIVPVPPLVLDLFLALSLGLAIVILLMSIQSKRPLDFSTFPTVLLISTLYRLSLNVASTRNILLRTQSSGLNAAGEIIKSFGSFVVGGNFAVGIIIFIILVIINFIVITKGAGRVAEVAARFTLDAMPGKQMAIDADLNAGIINEEDARKRRKEVAFEADFYGSMDGASKFVRGDAIAGILITTINIVGGIIIGMGQYGLSFTEASKLFTLLTVGDGLISQVPALIISTAAGIIITRGPDENSLGNTISNQVKVNPKAIYYAGGVLLSFILIPGLPKLPFLTMGLLTIYLGNRIEKVISREKEEIEIKEKQEMLEHKENLEELLDLELIELEVGYSLVNLVDKDQNGDLLERITHIRRQFATDWGVIVPSVRIKDNLELKPSEYTIRIKGIEIASGELLQDHFLAMDPGTVIEKIDGIETKEPVFGLPAVWITEEQKDNAQYNGYTVVDLSTVMATHITEVLKTNLSDLFGRQELLTLLDRFKENNPRIVDDLIPDILSLSIVLKVLKNLLKENISIRDLRTIFEVLAEIGPHSKNPEVLTENVRSHLFRQITDSIKGPTGDIPLFTLDKDVEEAIADGLMETDQGIQLSVEPTITQSILASLNEKVEQANEMGEKMVVLCSPLIRQHFKKLTEKFLPNLVVVAHNELSPNINIRSLGTVRL